MTLALLLEEQPARELAEAVNTRAREREKEAHSQVLSSGMKIPLREARGVQKLHWKELEVYAPLDFNNSFVEAFFVQTGSTSWSLTTPPEAHDCAEALVRVINGKLATGNSTTVQKK